MKNTKWHDLLAISILLVAILFSLRNLFLPGLYYGHDSIYHFARLYQYYYELTQGQIPVRLATNFVLGFGYPIFNYVYGLPYLLGSIGVALHVGYATSLKLLVGIFSVVPMLAWYIWLRRYFTSLPSLLGTLLYWFLPFRFVLLFVTFQLGAIIASGFFPVLLLGVDQLLSTDQRSGRTFKAACITTVVGFSGIILSHLVTLFIYAPFLMAYIFWKIFLGNQKKSQLKPWQQFQVLGWVAFITAGVTAFYWLPATIELGWVKAGYEAIVNYRDHFPTLSQLIKASWGYGYSEPGPVDGMSFQIGYAQILAFVLGLGLLMLTVIRRFFLKTAQSGLLLVGLVSFGTYFFLLLTQSDIFWRYLPLLSSVQHPWRLLIAIGASASLLTSLLANSRWGKMLAVGLVLLAVINTRNYQRPMSFEYLSEEQLAHHAELAGTGDVSWEFFPVWGVRPTHAVNSLLARTSEPVDLLSESKTELKLATASSFELVFNKIYFPLWQVRNNDSRIETHRTNDGLLAVSLPAGKHQLTLHLKQSNVEIFSNAISIFTLALLATFSLIKMKLPLLQK